MPDLYTVDEVTDSVIILRRRIFQEIAIHLRAIEAVHDRSDGYHIVTTSGHVYRVRRSSLYDTQLRRTLGLST